MKDKNYAVTITTIARGAGNSLGKSVRTDVKTPAEMTRVLRAAVQGAKLGGRKRVGVQRIGRRLA
jgi:hypothetical protein